MGHSDVSVTLNVYTSIFDYYKNSELEKVNNYYINNEIFKNQPQMLETNTNFPLENEQRFCSDDFEMEI
jgi:hypothetical protein